MSQDENTLILGIGGVGMHLAQRLVHEGYPVTVIEADADLLAEAAETLDARLICGNAMQLSSWREAHAEDMELLIATTNDDSTNMLASLIADRFGIERKIVRARSIDLVDGSILSQEDLKIDLIVHPEELVAQEIFRLVQRASCNDITPVGDGNMRVLAMRINEDSPLLFKTPKELSATHAEYNFRVVAIARGISTIIPQAEEQIRPFDQVFIMARTEDMLPLMDMMKIEHKNIEHMMILGGGIVGRRVAQLLEKEVEIKLIEKNPERAEQLASELKNTEVIHGDGTDANLLVMSGLDSTESFIATTGDNETNIISCLLAKHLMNRNNRDQQGGHGKTIALVNKEDYLVLASTIGLDIALNAKISAANEILKFVRRNELLSVAHLHGVDAEVVELIASPKSEIIRKPLKKLANYFRQHNILIGGVEQDGVWKVAVGTTEIKQHNRVVAVCSSQNLNKVRQLFN
jgi:trk system potassium uptake protein TrkA